MASELRLCLRRATLDHVAVPEHWDAALRGSDAVQPASALTWQESVGAAITLEG